MSDVDAIVAAIEQVANTRPIEWWQLALAATQVLATAGAIVVVFLMREQLRLARHQRHLDVKRAVEGGKGLDAANQAAARLQRPEFLLAFDKICESAESRACPSAL